jgi:site-specific recombinase XerD
LDAILETPDRGTSQGHRDYSVLLFLYNSGARASEVVAAQIGDLERNGSGNGSILIREKGNKPLPVYT